MGLQVETFDLIAQAQAWLEDAQTVAPSHHVRLETKEVELVGSWDRDRLAQVFRNLLGNAVKYSPHGGEIVVQIRRQAGEVLVAIRDQGLGIEAAALPHLFERFYRANETAAGIQGVGLGLYITKELVEVHGGRIWVESAGPGHGSTFSFTLPYAVPAGAPVAESTV